MTTSPIIGIACEDKQLAFTNSKSTVNPIRQLLCFDKFKLPTWQAFQKRKIQTCLYKFKVNSFRNNKIL